MRYSLKLLIRIWVIEFYKLNAGFFLFFFILFFGIVHPPELISYHVALIRGMIESGVFLALVMLIWLAYNIKCIGFTLRTIDRPENNMLINLQAFSLGKQTFLFVISELLHYLPMLIYSGFVLVFAINAGEFQIALDIVVVQLLICCSSIVIYLYRLNNLPLPGLLTKMSRYRAPEILGKKSFSFYLIAHTLAERKLALVVMKIASLFMLNVILVLNRNEFSFRDFILIFSVILLMHSFFAFYFGQFMEVNMSFSRNLPIQLSRRWLVYVYGYCLLLLPELIFMLINATDLLSPRKSLLYFLIGVGQLLLFTSVFYASKLNIKAFLKLIFAVYFLLSLLLLSTYDVPIMIAEWVISFVIFRYNYYDFEAAR